MALLGEQAHGLERSGAPLAAHDLSMRIGASLALTSALALTSVTPSALGEGLTLRELPDHVTEGRVILDASPSEVYAHATDYANWSAQLSDVREVRWEGGDRDHARVRFKSVSLGESITLQFDNIPGQQIRFHSVKAPTGGRARGIYTLTPVDGGKRTAVVARFYMDVVGVARLVVSDQKIRRMRHAKLELDLRDTERWFEQRSRNAD